MKDKVEQVQDSADGNRLPYVRPDLLEAGQITDVTLSNGNNAGADAAYS